MKLFETAIQPFTIEYNEKEFEVKVEELGPGSTIYLIFSKGGGLYTALTRAAGIKVSKFWATVPENYKRHEEAQVIGELIKAHFDLIKYFF